MFALNRIGWTGILLVTLTLLLAACGGADAIPTPIVPQFSAEGGTGAGNQMDISGALPFSGQVNTGSSYYTVNGLLNSTNYLVGLTGMTANIGLWVFPDASFTAPLCSAPAVGELGEQCQATSTAGGELYIEAQFDVGGTTTLGSKFTIFVVPASPGFQPEGAIGATNQVDLPPSLRLPGQIGATGANSYYRATGLNVSYLHAVRLFALADDVDLKVYSDNAFSSLLCSSLVVGQGAESCKALPNGSGEFYIQALSWAAAGGTVFTVDVQPLGAPNLFVETYTNAAGSVDADTIVELYAADGLTLLNSNDDGGTGGGFFSGFIDRRPAGTYYVRVVEFSAAIGKYSIRVNQTGYTGGPSSGSPATTENEANDTPGTATVLTLGVESDNQFDSASDEDWFVFTLP